MEQKTENVTPIPRFNDHGATCKQHANWMLDCEFTRQEERDTLAKALDNYITKDE